MYLVFIFVLPPSSGRMALLVFSAHYAHIISLLLHRYGCNAMSLWDITMQKETWGFLFQVLLQTLDC